MEKETYVYPSAQFNSLAAGTSQEDTITIAQDGVIEAFYGSAHVSASGYLAGQFVAVEIFDTSKRNRMGDNPIPLELCGPTWEAPVSTLNFKVRKGDKIKVQVTNLDTGTAADVVTIVLRQAVTSWNS